MSEITVAQVTPSPWKATQGQCDGKPGTWYDIDAGPSGERDYPLAICMVYGGDPPPSDRDARTNAHLIAAAPDLLAACQLFTKAVLDALHDFNNAGLACPSSIAFAADQARHAIKKAERGQS